MNASTSTKDTKSIPKEMCLDHTFKLLCEGYLFIPNRIRKYKTELFETRLMGKKVVCMSGKKAAELFYDQNLFTRKNVIPKRIQESLFGKNAIQTLVGAAHMHRKLLFMSLLEPDKIEEIVSISNRLWESSAKQMEKKSQVVLYDEASKIFFQTACRWAGVPLQKEELKQKAKDMCAMVDAFGAVGPRHWKGRCARNRAEGWAQEIIYEVRSGRLTAKYNSPLYRIAWHKELNGNLLDSKVAAVELINILRPITAIATYVTFAALALHTYPHLKSNGQQKNEAYREMFAQEVRRFYPFGPFLGAKVKKCFRWHGHFFQKDDLVFLDIYGTNHDPEIWDNPLSFIPERFENRNENPFDFIPQGGGDCKTGTRCPGERLTLELMKQSLDFLMNKIEYKVPLQDVSYSLRRIPTLPRSKIILTNVRRI